MSSVIRNVAFTTAAIAGSFNMVGCAGSESSEVPAGAETTLPPVQLEDDSVALTDAFEGDTWNNRFNLSPREAVNTGQYTYSACAGLALANEALIGWNVSPEGRYGGVNEDGSEFSFGEMFIDGRALKETATFISDSMTEDGAYPMPEAEYYQRLIPDLLGAISTLDLAGDSVVAQSERDDNEFSENLESTSAMMNQALSAVRTALNSGCDWVMPFLYNNPLEAENTDPTDAPDYEALSFTTCKITESRINDFYLNMSWLKDGDIVPTEFLEALKVVVTNDSNMLRESIMTYPQGYDEEGQPIGEGVIEPTEANLKVLAYAGVLNEFSNTELEGMTVAEIKAIGDQLTQTAVDVGRHCLEPKYEGY